MDTLGWRSRNSSARCFDGNYARIRRQGEGAPEGKAAGPGSFPTGGTTSREGTGGCSRTRQGAVGSRSCPLGTDSECGSSAQAGQESVVRASGQAGVEPEL
jgi:hypothetical protein